MAPTRTAHGRPGLAWAIRIHSPSNTMKAAPRTALTPRAPGFQKPQGVWNVPAPATLQPAAPAFRCDGRTLCSQMSSCQEATYFLKNCPGTKMDGNHPACLWRLDHAEPQELARSAAGRQQAQPERRHHFWTTHGASAAVALGSTRCRARIFCHSKALGISIAMACMHRSSQPGRSRMRLIALAKSRATDGP